MTGRPPRDRMQSVGTLLVGLAASGALIFSALSLNATHDQLQIAEQGQITDRYNAAITNLGSASIDVRLGGIYALQRIMRDSPSDQSTVVAVLCAFVRDHATAVTARPARRPTSPVISSDLAQPPTDIRAALAVVGTRDPDHDSSTTIVDFAGANLSGANLSDPVAADLSDAILTGANLSHAILADVDLSGARLSGADLSGALFSNVNLSGADLSDAKLTNVLLLRSADLTGAQLTGADLSGALLRGADLARVDDLSDADLSGADLRDADLTGVSLSDADLSGAYLSRANLTGADLTYADLTGADLTGAKGLRTSLRRSPTGSTPARNLRRQALIILPRRGAAGWRRAGRA